MATNNVPNVNTAVLNSTSVQTAQENLKAQDEAARRAQQRNAASDFESVHPGTRVASSAEPSSPAVRTATGHERIQKARNGLEKAFVEAGGKGLASGGGEKNLEAVSADQVETIQNLIDKLAEDGASQWQIAEQEAKRDDLIAALKEYQSAHAEVGTASGDGQTVSTTSSSENTDSAFSGEAQKTPEEKQLWESLDAQLKAMGVDRSGESDIEAVQKKFMLKLGAEVADLQIQEKELNQKHKELDAQLKAATKPEEKAKLAEALKAIKADLDHIGQRKLDLQKFVTHFASLSDRLLGYQVSRELGTNRPAARTQSSKPAQQVKTASAPTSATSAKPQTAALKTNESQSQEALLETASADTADSPEAVLAQTTANDFTGTNFAIASQGQSQRSEARKLDALIKKLILAAQSGNMEAVVSGLLILGKRQNILTTSMGAQTLVAMQKYEEQLGIISKQMGALKVGPTYSSQLAKLNADMNMYSSSRQMITQTFRDFLNAKEQIEELGHSVIGKLGQLGSRLASFQ